MPDTTSIGALADCPPLTFHYTNHRGELGTRRTIPLRVFFGSTTWHPEPQWLLEARDLGKGAVRVFAMRDMRLGGEAGDPLLQAAKAAVREYEHPATGDGDFFRKMQALKHAAGMARIGRQSACTCVQTFDPADPPELQVHGRLNDGSCPAHTSEMPAAPAGTSGWWCPACQTAVEPGDVTIEEQHDPRAGGCGGDVVHMDTLPAPTDIRQLARDLADEMVRASGVIRCFIEEHEDPGADAFASQHCMAGLIRRAIAAGLLSGDDREVVQAVEDTAPPSSMTDKERVGRLISLILAHVGCSDIDDEFSLGDLEELLGTHNAEFERCDERRKAAERRLAEEERAHLRTIDQRDAAEEALSQAFEMVCGRQPEWSNRFGYPDALEEISEQVSYFMTMEAIAVAAAGLSPREKEFINVGIAAVFILLFGVTALSGQTGAAVLAAGGAFIGMLRAAWWAAKGEAAVSSPATIPME